MERTARWLGERLGLTVVERQVLAFTCTAESSDALSTCLAPFARLPAARLTNVLSTVLKATDAEVRASLAPQSKLRQAGLVAFRPDRNRHSETWLELEPPFDALLLSHYETAEHLFAVVCPRAKSPELALAEFTHLSKQLELLIPLLRSGVKPAELGINVLIYGPPGSGKTQLVLAIAQALELSLECSGRVDEPNVRG